MNKLLSLSLIIACFVSFSCKNQSDPATATPTELKHIEIMAIHDEVMPKMSDINRTIKELRKAKTTITQNNTALLEMFDRYITDLENADESMMVWMKNYDKPKFSDQSEKTMLYLNNQLKEINQVKEDMLMSILNGKGLAKKVKETQAKTKG